MNQKLVKKIRKHIRAEFPVTEDRVEPLYLPTGTYQTQQFSHNDENGNAQYREIFWTQSVRLNPKSTHGAYKQAKKYVKRYNLESSFHG